MFPGMLHHWKRAHERWHGKGSCCVPVSVQDCCTTASPKSEDCCEPDDATRFAASSDDDGLGASFGVRRPLRFMAYKLNLDDAQVKELAAILNDLKTERAQAAVDNQRTVGLFAEALNGEGFDAAKAENGLKLRVQSAERLREAVLKALQRTHSMLNPEQRAKLAYLLRSGTLTI